MAKSPDAFRTISEVSDWLDTPAHVLRFWESKFTQVRPVKRAGGRRYYRPEDMALLGGIKTLLHDEGMTIKGVQKLLRDKGVRHVAALGPDPADPGPVEPQGPAVAEPPQDPPATVPPLRVIEEVRAIPPIEEDWTPLSEILAARDASQPAPDAVPVPGPAPDHDPEPAETGMPAPRTTDTDAAPVTVRRRPPTGLVHDLIVADRRALQARRLRIVPLAARLAALRDRMRAQG